MESRVVAGMRVVKNTLKEDFSHPPYDPMARSVFEGVIGEIEIEVLPACHLSEPIQIEIAEIMATEAAMDSLPRGVVIDTWKVAHHGRRIVLSDGGSYHQDPDFHLSYDRTEWARSKMPTH